MCVCVRERKKGRGGERGREEKEGGRKGEGEGDGECVCVCVRERGGEGGRGRGRWRECVCVVNQQGWLLSQLCCDCEASITSVARPDNWWQLFSLLVTMAIFLILNFVFNSILSINSSVCFFAYSWFKKTFLPTVTLLSLKINTLSPLG